MARTKRSRRSYGSGEWGRNRVRVFPDPKTGLYQLEWRENGRRLTRSLGHREWVRAKRHADEFAAGFASPDLNGKAEAEPEPLTLGGLFDIYGEEVTPTKGELLRLFGRNRDPATLSQRDWDRFIRARRAGRIGPTGLPVSDRTVERDLRPLLAVLDWAARSRNEAGRLLLDSNPLKGLGVPREKNPTRVVLSQAEYEAPCSGCPPRSIDAFAWRSCSRRLRRTDVTGRPCLILTRLGGASRAVGLRQDTACGVDKTRAGATPGAGFTLHNRYTRLPLLPPRWRHDDRLLIRSTWLASGPVIRSCWRSWWKRSVHVSGGRFAATRVTTTTPTTWRRTAGWSSWIGSIATAGAVRSPTGPLPLARMYVACACVRGSGRAAKSSLSSMPRRSRTAPPIPKNDWSVGNSARSWIVRSESFPTGNATRLSCVSLKEGRQGRPHRRWE